MNANLEIEYKMLLSQADFERLCSFYPQAEAVLQINTYYDCLNNPLKSRGMGMRIREKEGRFIFCLKQKTPEGHEEYETEVQENSLQALNEPAVQEIFHRLEICGPFCAVGQLWTKRAEIACLNGTLCLDQNQYYGKTDYELEFELYPQADPQKAQKELAAILKQINLTYKRNKRSKIQRCLEAKEEIG